MKQVDTGKIDVSKLVTYFDEAEDAAYSARLAAEKNRDYYDGKQIDAKKKAQYAKRGQPERVFNLIQQKVDFLLGYEKQTRTDPKAYPRTPNHDEAADACTDALRFVCEKEDFDDHASDCFENMLIEGTGGVSVEVEQRLDQVEVVLRGLRWDRLFIDPYSLERDCSDARYIGYVKWMDLDEAKRRWPKAAKNMEAAMAKHSAVKTTDDKPERWYSPTRQRVMAVDMCFRHKGEWHYAIFTKGAYLEDPKPSPYVDEYGVPQCKFIVASAKVDRDGQRYGIVSNYIDPQDEVNDSHSKAAHILHTRQTYSREGALIGENLNRFKREAAKPDGHLSFPGGGEFGKDFGIIPQQSLVGPHFSFYQDAKVFLDTSGANSALQGTADSGGLSGKAIRSLQQGGLLELGPLFDTHTHWKRRVYRAIWHRVRQYWTEERWIRVTDDEDNLQWVGLNVPMTQAEAMVKQQTGMKLMDIRQQFSDELMQLYQMQPQLAQPVVDNNVAELDVDIILEEVPDVVNVQQEQAEILLKLYQAAPEPKKMELFEDVIALLPLRNKDKLAGKELTPEQQQAMQQQQQVQQAGLELQMRDQMAKTAVSEATALEKQAKAQQTQVETAISVMRPDPNPQTIM